jgi:threonine aldolase
MNFASDNVYGVHPAVLASLSAVNDGTSASYGYEDLSRQAEAQLSRVFETPVRAFLVTTGTAANGLALSALTPSYGAVFCHAEAHIAVDECNSPEMFTGGAKIIGLHGAGGKITPQTIERTLKGFIRGEHDPKPATVALTNSTELGTIYSPAEIKAIADLVKPRGMKMFMDGARFGNAVVGSGATAAELTWKSGIDALSFGGTKNGGMMLESVIFFDPALAEDFAYRRMRGGQLISKSRYLAAQMLAYLKDDLWLHNARQANMLAARLSEGLTALQGIRTPHPVEANEVFAVIPRRLNDALLAAGAKFYDWMPDGVPGGVKENEIFVRFVLSFATPPEHVDQFLALAKRLHNG